MKKLTTICFLLGVLTQTAFSQGKTLHQNAYWLRYFNQMIFSDKVSWINEFDNRRFMGDDVQNQLIMHTHLHYLLNKNIEPAIGSSFSWIYTQVPEDGYKVVQPELRPFQEVTFHLAITKKLKFQTRVRVDERFIHRINKDRSALDDGYAFNFRFRFRPQINYKVNDKVILKAFDEVMYNDRYNTFDQNRISVAAEYIINKKFSVEASYLHIEQKRANYKGYYVREIARFSFIHKLDFKKKVTPAAAP